LELALGQAQLAHRAFDLSVLEAYRNDPRYYYQTNDVSGSIHVSDEYGKHMPESDRILLQSFGFAYDPSLNRAVAVFLRYLADLSPEHQRIWNTKLLNDEYKLHPDYYRSSILGQWYEGVSMFDAFTEELHCINEMCKLIGWPPLFRQEFREGTRPKTFAFLIRPTLTEFNGFCHLLDKMMSDNLNRDFFKGRVSMETEHKRNDGKVEVRHKGTIQMLDDWIRTRFRPTDRQPIDDMIAIFKEVRQRRQRPAHGISEDAFGQKYFREQRELMIKAYDSVRTIRLMLANHPKSTACEVPSLLQEGRIWTY
jgi:hypothetical protein